MTEKKYPNQLTTIFGRVYNKHLFFYELNTQNTHTQIKHSNTKIHKQSNTKNTYNTDKLAQINTHEN